MSYREFGRIGEAVFERWCLKLGYFIISTSRDVEGGGAAMADSREARWIKPDLHIALRGKSLFVDVKTKTMAVPYRNRGGILRTGCAYRNWQHYLRIQKETGIPGALAFIQVKEKQVWLGLLDQISFGSQVREKGVEYPTIFFNMCQFDRWELPGGELRLLERAATPPKAVHIWEDHRSIAAQVRSEWTQRTLDFGPGERYQ